MFCNNCGSQLPDGSTFCPNCGSTFNDAQANNQAYAQPPVGYNPVQPMAPAYPMGWFKFLIYFAFFAGAALSIINAVIFFTGPDYGVPIKLVYARFPDLQVVDMVCGVLSLIAAALLLYVRFQLAGYKKSAPTMIMVPYAFNIIVSLFQVIGGSMATDGNLEYNMTSVVTSCAVAVVMIIVNYIYFKKRKALFVR